MDGDIKDGKQDRKTRYVLVHSHKNYILERKCTMLSKSLQTKVCDTGIQKRLLWKTELQIKQTIITSMVEKRGSENENQNDKGLLKLNRQYSFYVDLKILSQIIKET